MKYASQVKRTSCVKCAFGTIGGTLNFTAPKEQLHYFEQHITNMSQKEKYKNILCSAGNTVQKLSEILELLDELPENKALVHDIVELIEDIGY